MNFLIDPLAILPYDGSIRRRIMLYRAGELMGFDVHALDGKVGHVEDVCFEDEYWTVRYLVVNTDVSGSEQQMRVSPVALKSPRWRQRVVSLRMTKAQLAEPRKGDATPSVLHPPEAQSPHSDHLRSCREVMGYGIQATDGELGRVEDFMVSDTKWIIRYLLLDTGSWQQGKKVTVATDWVDSIVREEAKVRVDLRREDIRDSPDYFQEGTIQHPQSLKVHGPGEKKPER